MHNTRSSILYKWWRSIDNVMFSLVIVLMIIGLFLIITASPAIAERLGIRPFHFVYRQLLFLDAAFLIIILLSVLDTSLIKRISLVGFISSIIMMILVLFIGDETKGAKRWLSFLGFALQPSEFLKPFYAVIIGAILSARDDGSTPGFRICAVLHSILLVLLLLQPDFGMTMIMSIVVATQMFVAGLSIPWLGIIFLLLLLSVVISYFALPHVAKRIEGFFKSTTTDDNYQITKSLESHIGGGFWGKGPGEGAIKLSLPDAHTDFIFAVAGEEMGALFCIIITLIFACIVMRGLSTVIKNHNSFYIYTVIGILMYIAIQAAFNIGVTMNVLPTKGVTLPFISYGGSSMISLSIGIGIYLGLTRKISSSSPKDHTALFGNSLQIILRNNHRIPSKNNALY